MSKKYNYISCIYSKNKLRNDRLYSYCIIDKEFISETKCYDCKNFRDYIFKVKCIEKKFYMWCEVGDILEVKRKIDADERWADRYAVKLNKVIGFYPVKCFEVIEEE